MCDCKLIDALMWCLAVPTICGQQPGVGELPAALVEPQKLTSQAIAAAIAGHARSQVRVLAAHDYSCFLVIILLTPC